MKWWLGVLTAMIGMLSVAVLSVCCNTISLSDNAAGVLISSLEVMVTALIGWQVFNAIENVKTLRKMEDLEEDLQTKSLLITTLNSQVLDIIEAHNERNLAQGVNYWENKYIHAVKSLKLFLRGNVDCDYEPLCRLLLDMSSIIERVDKEASNDEKIVFARSFKQFDEEHENIIEIIHNREDDLKRLRRQIVRLRDRRKKLFDDYASKETSSEKAERESRIKSEPKHNENPPS